MTYVIHTLSLFVVFAMVASTSWASAITRYALVIGANDGGSDRTLLQYAGTDAERVSEVLQNLAGLQANDIQLLREPSTDDIAASFATLREKIAADHNRTELFLYYSGHADETGIKLSGQTIGFGQLRSELSSIPADVKVAIIDSCASGAFARAKGGRKVPPFLRDDANRVKGHAILTSSSADEASQESDRIGSSYFTHYLVAGLSGAADASGDGNVTLNEAYEYTYNETLARTAGTMHGAQHPNYDIQLSGSGDLVLTQVRAAEATLVLDESQEGRLYLRTPAGKLALEVRKSVGQPIHLGVDAGAYNVLWEQDGQLRSGTIEIAAGTTVPLTSQQLAPISMEVAAARGGTSTTSATDTTGTTATTTVTMIATTESTATVAAQNLTFNSTGFSLRPGRSTDEPDTHSRRGFSMNIYGRYGALEGIDLSLIGSDLLHHSQGLQASLLYSNARQGFDGAQFTFGVARSSSKTALYRGAQLSFLAAISQGPMLGLQWTYGLAYASQITGAQVAGIAVANEVEGLQFGYVSVADKVHGVQAGVVAIADEVTGATVGLVNIAGHVRGVQLGLLNFAQDVSGASIGLFSFVRNGRNNLIAYWSDINDINVGFRLGTNYFHNYFVLGLQPNIGKSGLQHWSVGYGLGGNIPMAHNFHLSLDILAHYFKTALRQKENNALGQFQLTVGWQPHKRIGVFAGPTFNAMWTGFSHVNRFPNISRFGTYTVFEQDSSSRTVSTSNGSVAIDNSIASKIRVWPGVVAGIAF